MRGFLQIFHASDRQTAPHSGFDDGAHTPEQVKEQYCAILVEVLRHAGVDPAAVTVEARSAGKLRDGRIVVSLMVRMVAYQPRSVQRLTLGMPFIERAARKRLQASWLPEVSAFGGVWLHASTQLFEPQALRELKRALVLLEQDRVDEDASELSGSSWASTT